MDLGSAIFGIFTLACFIVPVIYLQSKKSKEKKEVLKIFKALAQQQGLIISAHDFWNHCYAIGLDSEQNKLFYFKNQDGREQNVVIDLTEVEKCSVVNVNRMVNDNKIIDRLGLSFAFRNPKLPEKILEFYTKEEGMPVNDEFQLSEKWKAIVDARLQAHPPAKESNPAKGRLRTAA